MKKIKNILKNEITGWKLWEVFWLLSATIIILGLSIYWKDAPTAVFASLTGIWCVILTGKGKLSSFWFGAINTILYSIIALEAKYFGEVMLNLIYYLPTNFIGIYLWSKNMNQENDEVIKTRLNLKDSVIIYSAAILCIIIYGFILKLINGQLPYIDAMSTILSIFAQILCIKRCMEQWIIWIVVDVVTVFMWIYAFINGTGDFSMILMWSVYLINAFIMFYKWNKDTK